MKTTIDFERTLYGDPNVLIMDQVCVLPFLDISWTYPSIHIERQISLYFGWLIFTARITFYLD